MTLWYAIILYNTDNIQRMEGGDTCTSSYDVGTNYLFTKLPSKLVNYKTLKKEFYLLHLRSCSN